jgi:hypothetical protein
MALSMTSNTSEITVFLPSGITAFVDASCNLTITARTDSKTVSLALLALLLDELTAEWESLKKGSDLVG